MKKIKAIAVLLLLMVCTNTKAQLRLEAGVVDLVDTLDGNTLAFSTGLSHIDKYSNFGVSFTFNGVVTLQHNYSSIAVLPTYRLQDKKDNYRLNLYSGPSMLFPSKKIVLVAGIRNSFRIGDKTWITTNFKQEFNNPRSIQFLVGLEFDVDIFKPYLKKIRI